jgi:demethylmenaquinone methyltransferase/2-methoxy-6-polyprenyl-1,4-benzoquinol methylase
MKRKSTVLDEILEEQRHYYCLRAPEYDEWWLRRGRFDHGDKENAIWFEEVSQIQTFIDQANLTGDVLELAGGTGAWTERLARRATRLTVLDASREMLALNSMRLARAGLRDGIVYREVDLFGWWPDHIYDAVFSAFWLSHVPAERLEAFLSAVAEAVSPGGTLAVLDSRREPLSTAVDQPLPEGGTEIMKRRLNDGRTFRIVKRFLEADKLASLLEDHGFAAAIGTTATHFLYGVARKQ